MQRGTQQKRGVVVKTGKLHAFVNAAPWPYFYHLHQQHIIFDGIKDAPVTNTDAIVVTLSTQTLTAWRPRIKRQGINGRANTPLQISGQSWQ
jgi:hypothetical protein